MNRWRLEQELFEQTAGLDPVTRARVLADRAGDDADLAHRVERLVAADAHPVPELDGTAADLWSAMHDEPAPESLCGSTFGPYRIDGYLASGGMAHVYLATRTSEGAARRVALKVLRSVAADAAFTARFQRERALLAALEHEYIVSFFDAGTLPDGRPFLVMEYVEGRPITEWCSGLPIARRIDSFLQVLIGVQYAHQRLVVHRDLKPSNVLVTPQGTPKLLDFGIATALGPGGEDDGDRGPLTPGYASPEQLRGEAVTTASDLYSLGLLLREITTGSWAPNGGAAIPRDLAAIVDRACASVAAERYRSADEFAADLRRFLGAEPVVARPASLAHRARLFTRRNRWPLALAACALVATAAGFIGSELRRRAAEREASKGWGAHAEAKSAAAVFERFVSSLAESDPSTGAAAVEYLEGALRGELSNLPEAETMVRLALADLLLRMGDRDRALPHAERAAALAAITPGVGSVERRRAASLLDRIRLGDR